MDDQNAQTSRRYHDKHRLIANEAFHNLCKYLRHLYLFTARQKTAVLLHIHNHIINKDTAAHRYYRNQAARQAHQNRNGKRNFKKEQDRRCQKQNTVSRLESIVKQDYNQQENTGNHRNLQRCGIKLYQKKSACQKRDRPIRQTGGYKSYSHRYEGA